MLSPAEALGSLTLLWNWEVLGSTCSSQGYCVSSSLLNAKHIEISWHYDQVPELFVPKNASSGCKTESPWILRVSMNLSFLPTISRVGWWVPQCLPGPWLFLLTERVGCSPQTPFIWESRLPGTKPGNGPSLPRAARCQPRCSHALSLPLAPGMSKEEDQFSLHPTISTPLTTQKTIQKGIQRICWNFNEEIWVSEHM